MKNKNEILGKNILLLGYGREGESVHKYIVKNYPDVTISVADKKSITPVFKVSKIYTGTEWLSHLEHFDTIVRSPGVSKDLPEVASYSKAGGRVTSSTNIFFSLKHAMVVGVTGTKGKSTTTSMVAHLLAQKFIDVRVVGNIGMPPLDYLEGETDKTIYVFELSSHQLSDIRYSPNIAVILSIVPEHLDYYSSFETYVQAKSRIVLFQRTRDSVVYNQENYAAKAIAMKSKARKIPYSLRDRGVFFETQLLGNKENITAALFACSLFGLSKDKMRHGLQTFRPLPHRLEPVGEYKGILFYNDSLATIPEATIHAIQALGSKTETLIAGGFDRGISYEHLGKFLITSSIKTLILMGETGKKIAASLPANHAITVIEVRTMKDAVEAAYAHTITGKICVLSPASTSFDQFKDYKDRGEQFTVWVKRVATE